MAGTKHCGDVCGCNISRKVEGHYRQRTPATDTATEEEVAYYFDYYIIILVYVLDISVKELLGS